jgi:hypothetical protein
MSTGRTHPPITLLACEFIPPNPEFLLVADLTPETNDHMQAFATVRTLQYGLREYNVDQVKQKCRDHFEAISNPRKILEDRSTLRCKLLLAICRFVEGVPDSEQARIYFFWDVSQKLIVKQKNLMRKAVMMNRIQYVMGRRIVFNEDSAFNAVSSLQHQSETPPLPSLSSRVLTRQIKGVMNLLLEDLTTEVLQELDSQLRRKKTGPWIICLCTFLVLCMSAEDIQVAVDGFAVFKASSQDGHPNSIVQDGTEACGKLEKEALEHSWLLLNGILKRILKRGNPFRCRDGMKHEPGQNEAEVNLLKDLRQLMTEHSNHFS